MEFPPVKICEYCGQLAKLVTGNTIYPHRMELSKLNFWLCETCDAYVGCHKPNAKYNIIGTEPLGRMANAELRAARTNAHEAFDPMWKSKKMTRTKAYSILAKFLKIKDVDCHIGNFDVEQCNRIINSRVKLWRSGNV